MTIEDKTDTTQEGADFVAPKTGGAEQTEGVKYWRKQWKHSEPDADKLITGLDVEKKKAQYEQYRETVKGRILMSIEEQDHQKMASVVARDFFHDNLNEEQTAQLEGWQPNVAEDIALQSLTRVMHTALENKAKPHEFGAKESLRIQPSGGPNEQQKLDFQQGENLLYSILISNKEENVDWEKEIAAQAEEMRPIREAAGAGEPQPPKWHPREYETIIPGGVLSFKDPAEVGDGPLAEFEIDSKKQ